MSVRIRIIVFQSQYIDDDGKDKIPVPNNKVMADDVACFGVCFSIETVGYKKESMFIKRLKD